MKDRTTLRFRPTVVETLEDRTVLSLDTTGILSAALVHHLRLSRAEIGQVIAGQIRAAYTQFSSSVTTDLDAGEAAGNVATLQANLPGYLDTLESRIIDILSTSPRAAGSLNSAIQEAILGPGSNSLTTRLRDRLTAADATSDFAALRQDIQGIIQSSQRAVLARLHTFVGNPWFDFLGVDFEARQGLPSTSTSTDGTTDSGTTTDSTTSTTTSTASSPAGSAQALAATAQEASLTTASADGSDESSGGPIQPIVPPADTSAIEFFKGRASRRARLFSS